jgi:flagellar biosynthesis/type III secretory pathway chaperone
MDTTSISWLDSLHSLLHELKATQEQLLAALSGAQRAATMPHIDVFPGLASPEHALLQRLRDCSRRRAELLKAAAVAGWPSHTLRAAALAQPDSEQRRQLQAVLAEAESLGRRVQLASLTQSMLAQRALAHVGQVLEILATGTPQPPTYGNGPVSTARGGLLDEAA